jgi:hypothetical protein
MCQASAAARVKVSLVCDVAKRRLAVGDPHTNCLDLPELLPVPGYDFTISTNDTVERNFRTCIVSFSFVKEYRLFISPCAATDPECRLTSERPFRFCLYESPSKKTQALVCCYVNDEK